MKLCKPLCKIIEQEPGINGIYKMIEYAGRVCYKSEDKITEDSAKSFIDRMVKSGHGAMLEHGTVYLHIKDYYNSEASKTIAHYTGTGAIISSNFSVKEMQSNPYSKCNIMGLGLHGRQAYITTNYRAIIENNWLDDLEYLCEPTEYHEKRVTVKFILSRSIAQEYTRHRVFSFAMESQRYCAYNKDKFGNEVTFIIPCWTDLLEGSYTNISKRNPEDGEFKQIMLHENNINAYPVTTTSEGRFLWNCFWSEHDYFDLLNEGWKPQQAREVLPNACKTELVMTGFVDDWWGEYLVIDKATGLIDQRIHGKFYDELNNIDRDKYRVVEKGFFPLRCSSGAHPQAQELAIPLRQEFINKKIW